MTLFYNRNLILLIVISLLLIASIYMVKRISRIELNTAFKKNACRLLSYMSTSIIIGTGLNAAGMEFKFAINHMPILLFSSATLITAGVEIVECVRFYRNFKEVIKRANTIFISIIECMVLVLSIMGRLEVIELIAAVIGCMTIQIVNVFINNCIKTQYKDTTDNINILMEDYPINQEHDLFDSRKRQLETLYKELNQLQGEPFAVAISGNWGSGKTSFINILKKKLNQAEFINIECGIEHDVKVVLKDISSQMQEIYKKNHVYIERNGIIENYFEKIGEFVGDVGYGGLAKIIDKFKIKGNSNYLENKEIMDRELDIFYHLTKKRIYFIVDDMDRVIDEQTRAVLFQVIRESVSLKNCITLFMVDYNKFTNCFINKEFLEKYVNRQYELCDTKFEEIIIKYEEVYLTDSFWDGKSNYIANYGKIAKKDIIKKDLEILSDIQSEIQKIQKIIEYSNKKEESEQDKTAGTKTHMIRKNQEKQEYLLATEKRLQSRMRNPRKVKRYLDYIEKMLTLADMLWFQNENFISNEYSGEDWVEIIFEVAFLKAFLYEEFTELVKAGSLNFFKNDFNNWYIVEFVFSGFFFESNFGKKEEVIELIVYRLYTLDIKINKTEHQRIIEELDSGKLQEEKLNLYVDECIGINFNYRRAEKLLDFLEIHDFKSRKYKHEIIINIMSILSGRYNLYEKGLNETMKRIKSIIDYNRKFFTTKEENMIEGYIKTLQSRIIFAQNSNICTLLGILNSAEFDEYFDEGMDSITQLYETILKINELYPLLGFIQSDSKIETLINYFNRMEEVFKEEEFCYARDEIIYFLNKVTPLFEILEIWYGKVEDPKIEQYYNLAKGEFEQGVLKDVDNLMSGLDEFEEYIVNNQKDLKTASAFIRLLSKIEDLDRNSPNYFGKNRNKIIIKLNDIYKQLQENPFVLQKFDDSWRFCKIRLFRLQRNSSISENMIDELDKTGDGLK